MSRFSYFILTVLFLSFALVPAFASESTLNLAGNGARAAGMGYAFTGVADDATAISWNAAGLTQLYSMEASVIARFGFGSYAYEGWPDAPDVEYASKFNLNFASFVFPFSVGRFNVVGGVAYRTIYDFNQEITVKWETGDVVSSSEGGVNAISPAIGFQLNDMMSFGATLNIYTGSLKSKSSDDRYGTSYDGSPIDFSGTSVDVGILLRPNSKFSVGANLNFPNKLKTKMEGESDELAVPFFFSVGGAFRATDNLLIAFDYFSRSWSKSEDFKDEDNPDQYDLNSIHVGLEYLLTSGNAVMPIRLGFFTNPLFGTLDKDNNQVVDKVITAGIGLVMKKIILDGAIEFEPSSIGVTDDISIEQKLFRVTIGATVHFGQD
ncbi:MAG TPA: hypothetical protein ENK44_05185 [Caldithrix abyssi]|uniref:PorV/PorQ family protein n=1 Tax=Caldithrix abyssi TaxID=187145 RepID=A0A7V4TZI5_CALAY|nr:hypothetical protein [Caldithrix abyssi]